MRKIFGRQHNQTVIDFYNKRYDEEGSMCPPSGWGWQHTHGRSTFYHKYNERCKVSEILADEVAVKISSVPTERTETPEEALQLSIWSPHTTFNISTLRFFVYKEKNKVFILVHFFSESELDEAFCRDIESFSPAFTPRVTPQRLSLSQPPVVSP